MRSKSDVYKIIGADGREYGPITIDVLRQWISEGRANRETKVLPDGATEWKTVADLPELTPTAPARPPGPPPTLTAPGPISITPTPRNNPLAVAGLTLGIIGLTVGLCCCYGLPFSVPGLVCSIMALNQFKKDPANQQGKGMAVAGLVLSGLGLVFGVVILIVVLAVGTPDILRQIRKF